MILFKYKSIDKKGKPLRGISFAETVDDLSTHLEREQKFLRTARPLGYLESKWFMYRAKKDIIPFFMHIKFMVEAGLNIIDAIDCFQGNTALRNILFVIRKSIIQGNALGKVMGCFPDLFPPLALSCINIGEKTGKIADAFTLAHAYLVFKRQMERKIIDALRYPLFLFLLFVLLAIFLSKFIVPDFLNYFNSEPASFSFSTYFLLKLLKSGDIIFLTLFFVCFFAHLLIKFNSRLNAIFHRFIFRLFSTKNMLILNFQMHFFHHMLILHQAGYNHMEALKIIMNLQHNSFIKKQLTQLLKDVTSGKLLSCSMQGTGLFPSYTIQLMISAEKTGSFSEAYKHLTDILIFQFESALQTVIKLLNPILILFVGILLLWVVTALFIPLYRNI